MTQWQEKVRLHRIRYKDQDGYWKSNAENLLIQVSTLNLLKFKGTNRLIGNEPSPLVQSKLNSTGLNSHVIGLNLSYSFDSVFSSFFQMNAYIIKKQWSVRSIRFQGSGGKSVESFPRVLYVLVFDVHNRSARSHSEILTLTQATGWIL